MRTSFLVALIRMMARRTDQNVVPSIPRRTILKGMAAAPLMLRTGRFWAWPIGKEPEQLSIARDPALPFSDYRLSPHYPTSSPLADIIRRVPPGSDEYIEEKYAIEIEAIFKQWSQNLIASPHNVSALELVIDPAIEASSLAPFQETRTRSRFGLEVVRRQFSAGFNSGSKRFIDNLALWLGPAASVKTAEFEIYSIHVTDALPLTVTVKMRYDLVLIRSDHDTEERVGAWMMDWSLVDGKNWIARQWLVEEETACIAHGPVFIDVSSRAFGTADSYKTQLMHGADHWRTVLDGAVGTDVYCNNGIAAGDFNNDGFDDLYICQPAGLPNRLFRNRGDGSFEDVTEKSGVGVLDNTACALFADFQNRGLQDLLVVCGTGPVLFVNQGDGTFSLKRDAFKFARPPQGTFTHAAVADYDLDGRLDVYFCLYMYYLGLDQYHYPIPYYDARNGPPNCLFHNQGDGTFVETTEAAGLNTDNNRYSFACSWGDSNSNGLQDLFVANDFGSSQLYRNNGNGTFTVASREANVEGVGAGMSCCWCDYDNDGRQDVYVPSMWEAAGQRVSSLQQFHKNAPESIRTLYQRHARGNALYRNQGHGRFENAGRQAGVEMGRWSWSSDFFDFDHDGLSDLYVANGYISGPDPTDLASFFWRQVVAKSSDDATPSLAYERAWNAINELIRSDHTWHGFARNVLFLNNGDGTFCEASGAAGMDFAEDCRSFALADIDHDGRLEVILKSRNAPQIRVLHNVMESIGHSICFRLRGHAGNRDAIGAAVTVESNGLRQTKYLQAGSGFLAQHTKDMFFGIGGAEGEIRAIVHWPGGAEQAFDHIPSDHRITIEEGSASFKSTPFVSTPDTFQKASPAPAPEGLPEQSETWLIEPFQAPAFSLPDLRGQTYALGSYAGRTVLLIFWAKASIASLEMVELLSRNSARASAAQLQMIAINLDDASHRYEVKSLAERKQWPFPVLFATDEMAGIYNLIYLHLFDRHRNLPIASAFLLDQEGRIVKVYQGTLDPDRLLADAKSIPATATDRMRKALPFAGVLVQDKFARNDFTYGVAMFQHGYFEQAAESFKQVIAAKPDNADAYYNLGTLSLRRHDLNQARVYLEKTVTLRPEYPEAWNNLGMMAAEEGNLDEAEKNFLRSIDLRPRYAIALLNLGNVYRRQKSFDKAEEFLNRAIALLPDDAEINYSLGMLYAQKNQMQSASEYLQKALNLRPNYPEASNNLGIVFVRQQDYTRAEEQFKTGIRVSPEFDQSYLNLARLYAMRNDKEKARQVLNDLLHVEPGNPDARQALEVLR
jgi:tetratricopeptide (TPR) repeat protein